MGRKAAYWVSTILVAVGSVGAGITYLMAAPQAVEGFAHVGYPQQLRVMLGLAKIAGAIVVLSPGVPRVKEWAYAGFTFAWIAAIVAHYLAGDGPVALTPATFLLLLVVSYVSRPADRRWPAASKTLA